MSISDVSSCEINLPNCGFLDPAARKRPSLYVRPQSEQRRVVEAWLERAVSGDHVPFIKLNTSVSVND